MAKIVISGGFSGAFGSGFAVHYTIEGPLVTLPPRSFTVSLKPGSGRRG